MFLARVFAGRETQYDWSQFVDFDADGRWNGM